MLICIVTNSTSHFPGGGGGGGGGVGTPIPPLDPLPIRDMTSEQRCINVDTTSCACWVISGSVTLSWGADIG